MLRFCRFLRRYIALPVVSRLERAEAIRRKARSRHTPLAPCLDGYRQAKPSNYLQYLTRLRLWGELSLALKWWGIFDWTRPSEIGFLIFQPVFWALVPIFAALLALPPAFNALASPLLNFQGCQ